jgi:O-methyltransferase domain
VTAAGPDAIGEIVTQHQSTAASRSTEINAADRLRLDETVAFVRDHDDRHALAAILPGMTREQRAMIGAHCRFTHAAALIFPDRLTDARESLRAYGLAPGEMFPSVVVRDRLSARYGLDEPPDVGIVHAPVDGHDGQRREIELFLLAAGPEPEREKIAEDERTWSWETHVAFDVTAHRAGGQPDPVVLTGLHAVLSHPGRLSCDGGGYNGHEDMTVLYFRNDTASNCLGRRLELRARGRHTDILRTHLVQSSAPRPPGSLPAFPQPGGADGDPANRLLRLMTGAWTTQAIAVAAELSLADHIARDPAATSGRLAELTASDPDCLHRLLRYLGSLGIVRTDGGTVRLTDVGELLRTDAEHSLHALARIYGGSFYRSFGALLHTVRTGQQGFEHVFGDHHFDYFAQRPHLAFDRAMAASSAMFGSLLEIVDFSAANVVVDVGGGDGQLLGQVLRAAPHLRGVLLERPNVIDAARRNLDQLRRADRCEFVAGDFTAGVPGGGDIYVLSRVLHDWDDEQALRILRNCAAAMPEHGELFVIERLLPEDESPSLAAAWDIHMMCNVGGRERTAEHYRRLLHSAGFEVTWRHELPLDAALLRARRR